jgi:hypothetical protein
MEIESTYLISTQRVIRHPHRRAARTKETRAACRCRALGLKRRPRALELKGVGAVRHPGAVAALRWKPSRTEGRASYMMWHS